MGLDIYAVRPGDPAVTGHATLSKPVTFQWLPPADIEPFKNLPRGFPEGLFWPSDSDITGFRGGVYQKWAESTLSVSLYELADPAEVRELADQIGRWLAEARAAGTTEADLGDSTVPLSGIAALGDFYRAAADQGLWAFPDY